MSKTVDIDKITTTIKDIDKVLGYADDVLVNKMESSYRDNFIDCKILLKSLSDWIKQNKDKL